MIGNRNITVWGVMFEFVWILYEFVSTNDFLSNFENTHRGLDYF